MNSKFPPIAVVGVSALFPGSLTAGEFWKNIMEGEDLLSDIPESHFLLDDYYDPDPRTPDKTYAKRGGFIPDVAFAPMDFGVPPNIIPATDTAQLLALNVAQRVLEDAANGQFADMDREKVSCILGVASATELVGHMSGRLQQPVWERALRNIGLDEDQVDAFSEEIAASYQPWQESTFPGLLGNVVAGRIANRLDLGGTNVVVDAACASSLAALDIGLNELYLGQSDLVISGGVDTLNDILMFMCFSKTPALSPSGDCRPFSDAADGTMLGEGIGMVAMKRLEDAERDGDQVYAVIKAIGSSSDGRSKSIYAPVSTGQAKALRRCYEYAGYGPETVELVEAHGTGTKAGDKAEFGGLEIVFRDETNTDANQWCALGTVKSQIGHTKAAAGSAGLFKVIAAVHHKVVPPTVKVDAPHPDIDFEHSPFYLSTETRPWIRSSDHPRRASVSAFGFGGTNFHCTVEEYTGDNRKGRLRTLPSELFAWSADDVSSLVQQLNGLNISEDRFRFLAQDSLANFIASNNVRASIVATDAADLQKKIKQVVDHAQTSGSPISMPNGVHFSAAKTEGDVGFLFPGQGSQYVNMGAELAMFYDAAREVWDQAADTTFDGLSVDQLVFPIPVFTDADRDEQHARLTQTEWAQPAIGTASVATLRVLESMGLTPKAVGGHSYGEITSLFAANVLERDDMHNVSRKRGELMAAASVKDGSMTAVVSDIDTLTEKLSSWGLDLVVANHNAPTQIVVSGATAEIEAFEKHLEADGTKFKRLPVSTAFHSPIVSDSSAPFADFLSTVEFTAPILPVYANSTAAPYPQDADEQRAVLAHQIGKPVRFVEQIEAMYDAGIRTFVEVGPDAVLTNLVGKILEGKEFVAVATDRRGKRGIESFYNGIAQLAVSGVELQLSALWDGYQPVQDPAAQKAPALTIDLGGANYDKPSPYREPTERAKQVAKELNTPKIVEVPVEVPVHVPGSPSQPVAAGTTDALERLQRETARVQSEYQRMMADSHSTFLQMAETSLRGLIGDGSSVPSRVQQPFVQPAKPVAHTPVMTHSPTPVVAQPVAAKTPVTHAPTPVAENAVAENAVAENAVAEQAQGKAQGQAQQTAVAEQAQQTAVAEQAQQINLVPVMLDVVADKTGYPTEMLELGMELEADLGIDSIKRVEILSAMQEKVPSLPEVETSIMASLVTLQEIVDYMQSLMGSGPLGPPAPSPASNVDLVSVMLDVVADKTGYPTEMLELGMELESDLGIDSIKRVEILSAMQEKVPSLPEVETSVMASLVTLQEIVDYMQSLMGSGPLGPPAPSPASNVDLVPVMLDVVADKTGYPSSMLELSMELESDLGIDSIKRVEILSAMQEKVPSLPEVETSVMASLVTLQEIVDYMQSLMGDGPLSPTAPSPASNVDLVSVMLDVVADKTGYPASMLDLSMELESDLGIDSIKRVEILSAMQDQVPSLPEVETAVMASLVTLQEIVDYMQSLMGGGEPAPIGADSEAPTRETTPLAAPQVVTRYAVKPVAAPTRGFAMFGLNGLNRVTVVTPNVELGAAFQNALTDRGISTVHAQDFSEVAADARCVIYLSALETQTSIVGATAVQRDAFQTANKIAASFEKTGGVFVTVQNTGGDFARSVDHGTHTFTAGLTGLVKTAHKEWPLAAVRAIDLDAAQLGLEQIANAVLNEMWNGGSELEVGISANGSRSTFAAFDEPVGGKNIELTSDDVIIVSGGARGVTAASIIELAKRTRASFVLLGRSEIQDEPAAFNGLVTDAELKSAALQEAKRRGEQVKPKDLARTVKQVQATREILGTLDALNAAGSRATYVAADVRDRETLSAGLQNIREQWGPITGIVHGAGVLADASIAKKTVDQWDFVFETKVDGLQSLLDITTSDPVKLLCFFSSVAARTGNPGQSDYAMANEVLNRVAAREQLRRPNAVVKSIGWGPWESGMVTPELAKLFASRGIALIGLAEGAAMFADEVLNKDASSVEVVIGGGVNAGGLNQLVSEGVARAELEVGPRAQPYLKDHQIKGNVVVPMVMAMEWLARESAATNPASTIRAIRDVRVMKGVTFDNGNDQLHFTAQAETRPDGLQLELRDDQGQTRYTAQVELNPNGPEELSFHGLNGDVSEFEISRDEFYTDETLFHGPLFQCLRNVDHMSKTGAKATMHGVADAKWQAESWVTDPLLMDGCLQLALLWGLRVVGEQTLPMRIETVVPYAPPTSGELHCELVARDISSIRTLSDMRVTDSNGNLVCDLRGVEMYIVPSGTAN